MLVNVLSDILSDWPSLHRQHDASEFYTYICARLCPSLVHGAWACRTMQGDIADTIDQGHSANAIALPTSHRCTLDFMMHKWAQQGDRCALVGGSSHTMLVRTPFSSQRSRIRQIACCTSTFAA